MKAVTTRLSVATPPPDPEVLIREARRRQRRRRLAVIAVIVAAGLAYGGIALLGPAASRPARPPASVPARPHATQRLAVPSIPQSVRATVLIWTYLHGTWLEQPGSDGFRHSGKPVLSVGDYQPALTHTGGWLVYVGDGTSAIREDLSGRPRKLWTRVSEHLPPFMPAAELGHVWLVFNDHNLQPRRPEHARLVSVPAGQPGRKVTIPHGYWLVSGTERGLLLSGIRGGLALWRPGSPPRRLPYTRNGGLSIGFGATARLVAYGTRCDEPAAARSYTPQCGILRAYDVVTGRLTSVPAPPGTAAWAPYQFNRIFSIAPGNAMLAATAIAAPEARHGHLYVVRLDGTHPSVIRVPHAAGLLLSCITWSPRGSWLFYPGPGSRLWAYQATTGKVRSSRLPSCRDAGIMIAYPTPSRAR